MKEHKKCAPTKNFKEGSCFTLNQLEKISEVFNEAVRENKLKNNKIKIKEIKIKKDKRFLLEQITDRLENVCSNQICWLKQKFIRNIKDKAFYKNLKKLLGQKVQMVNLNG